MNVVCVVESRDVLGEGPVWDAARSVLWWLDIKGRRLHRLEPASGETAETALPVLASSVAPRADGGLVMATADGVGVYDPDAARFDLRHDPEPERPWNRSNDGNVDVAGRYWFGTMDDAIERSTGAVYRLDPDWTCTRVLDGIGISNTLVCSPDGRTLYIADTLEGMMRAYPLDPATGALGEPKSFLDARDEAWGPDGSAVDAEGYLWNAQWGGWRVARYAPDGRLDRVVEMPVEQPSSCAFGGPDLRTLYVTSARQDLSAEALEAQPLAGALFAFEPGVPGLGLPPFAG